MLGYHEEKEEKEGNRGMEGRTEPEGGRHRCRSCAKRMPTGISVIRPRDHTLKYVIPTVRVCMGFSDHVCGVCSQVSGRTWPRSRCGRVNLKMWFHEASLGSGDYDYIRGPGYNVHGSCSQSA